MSIQSLRGFQEEAVTSGVGLFTAAKELLAAAGADAAGRAAAINHNGYLLIEAATGSGKTLMAGTIVERFTQIEDVVWFWFAPFKGVVGQSAAFLREQFHGLRLRELTDDRVAAGSRRGDVLIRNVKLLFEFVQPGIVEPFPPLPATGIITRLSWFPRTLYIRRSQLLVSGRDRCRWSGVFWADAASRG